MTLPLEAAINKARMLKDGVSAEEVERAEAITLRHCDLDGLLSRNEQIPESLSPDPRANINKSERTATPSRGSKA